MTTEEKARKIVEGIVLVATTCASNDYLVAELAKSVADELRAVREEGRQEMRDVCTKHGHDEYKSGYVRGLLRAAEMVVNAGVVDSFVEIAERIRKEAGCE